jgi:hypothetical protein
VAVAPLKLKVSAERQDEDSFSGGAGFGVEAPQEEQHKNPSTHCQFQRQAAGD